jgi:hypothetical protein
VGQIGLAVEQWPPGYTQHQVWARLEDGTQVLLAEFDGYTTIEMSLSYLLSTPLDNVVAVRVRTLKTPAWVGWKEINVVRMPPAGEACLLSLPGSGELKTGPGSEYKTNITLSLGQVVYADAYAVDAEGNRWWRAPSDQWIADAQVKAGEACGTLPEVEGPDVKTVPVTFMVTVPDNTTGDVMMGGSFPGTPFPPWIPYTIQLQKLSGNVYSVTLDLPVGTRVEYLYNRNSWDSIERPENCGAINPRTFVVEDVEEMLLEDVVIKWHDLDGCG